MIDTVVIGLGNPLMSDEGVGVRVLERLRAGGLPEAVEAMDLGTSGMAVLHAIAGRERAVFIDCACMGCAPGTLRRFVPDEVRSRKVATRLSLHEGDLVNTLALSRRLGECPAEVVLFGIEPAEMGPGLDLSPALAANVDRYAEAVRRELEAAHA